MYIIQVTNLSKQYRLGQVGTGTIKDDVKRWWHRIRGKEDPFLTIGDSNDRSQKGNSEYIWALKNINFSVQPGEVLGIIGRNGAGKSTLLKLLSRVTEPTTGRIAMRGRVASLLEVGTGFHPDLTGRENIYLNGAILGMTKKEITRKFDEIVDFAGVERYIDTPVKRYSSGMHVRLGFAVAAHLEPEILIVDEVLAVGDAEFQKKCLGKMKSVSTNEGRTVLFVSHNMEAISNLCTRALLIEHGTLTASGLPADMVRLHLKHESTAAAYQRVTPVPTNSSAILHIHVLNQQGQNSAVFDYTEPVSIRFALQLAADAANANLFVTFLDDRKRRIFSCESASLQQECTLNIPGGIFTRGQYSIQAFINVPKVKAIDEVEDACAFSIIDHHSPMAKHGGYDYGSVFVPHQWQ